METSHSLIRTRSLQSGSNFHANYLTGEFVLARYEAFVRAKRASDRASAYRCARSGRAA